MILERYYVTRRAEPTMCVQFSTPSVPILFVQSRVSNLLRKPNLIHWFEFENWQSDPLILKLDSQFGTCVSQKRDKQIGTEGVQYITLIEHIIKKAQINKLMSQKINLIFSTQYQNQQIIKTLDSTSELQQIIIKE